MIIISLIITYVFITSAYFIFGEEIGAFSIVILGLTVIITDRLRFWRIKPFKFGKIDVINQVTIENALDIYNSNTAGLHSPVVYLIPDNNEEIYLFGSRNIVITSGFADRYRDCPEKLALIIAEQTSLTNFIDNISYDIIYITAFVFSLLSCIAGMLIILLISLFAARKISSLLNKNLSDMISVSVFLFLFRKLIKRTLRNYANLDEILRAKSSGQYRI